MVCKIFVKDPPAAEKNFPKGLDKPLFPEYSCLSQVIAGRANVRAPPCPAPTTVRGVDE